MAKQVTSYRPHLRYFSLPVRLHWCHHTYIIHNGKLHSKPILLTDFAEKKTPCFNTDAENLFSLKVLTKVHDIS